MKNNNNDSEKKSKSVKVSLVVSRSRYRLLRLVMVAVLSALAVALVYMIHLPIIPSLPFLEYDPADIPIFIVTILFGWQWGMLMTVVVSIVQGLTVSAQSGVIGIIMHIFATGSFVLVSGIVDRMLCGAYRRGSVGFERRTLPLVISFVFGLVAMLAAMMAWNYIFTPIFLGTDREAIIPALPLILLFNFIKGGLNASVAIAVFASGKLARYVKYHNP